MGANEMRAVVARQKARNDAHATNEGLKESETLKVAHDRRANVRRAAATLMVLRQRIDRVGKTGSAEFRELSKQISELAQLVDLLFGEVLAGGGSR